MTTLVKKTTLNDVTCNTKKVERKVARTHKSEGRKSLGWKRILAVGAAVALIIGVAVAGHALTPWLHMWSLALAIYIVCKWATWWPAARDGRFRSARLSAGYLLAWPGMDVTPFCEDSTAKRMECGHSHRSKIDKAWLAPITKVIIGMTLLAVAFPWLKTTQPLPAGWLAMVGLLCVLHFGSIHLLALWWRARGVAVEPIMQKPLLARNLGEFWSRRWNRAFADLAARFALRPIARRWNAAAGLLASFVASGVIHDLVISVPARGGYGLPTLYFTISGVAVLLLRGKHARRCRLNTGWRGRAMAVIVLALPLPLVAHEPFIMNVILPFMDAVTTFNMEGALP